MLLPQHTHTPTEVGAGSAAGICLATNYIDFATQSCDICRGVEMVWKTDCHYYKKGKLSRRSAGGWSGIFLKFKWYLDWASIEAL